MGDPVKAIGMISGGLDSTLALALVQRQGIEVLAVHFHTGFGVTEVRRQLGWTDAEGRPPTSAAERAAQRLGIPLRIVDISGPEYMQMLLHPKHGYGRFVNPCIDCHALMLRKCGELMAETGARFVFTGEVLGQRPKSQRFHALRLVEQDAGLEGLLLRPLSARALPPTVAEQRGWIDRARLLDITGRSRTRQMALAAELGIDDYPSPAGGCLLTDEGYARRFRDLIAHSEAPDTQLAREDFVLLSVGRHLRLGPRCAVVVGREHRENLVLQRLQRGRWLLEAEDATGPTTLVLGQPTVEDLALASAITAGYGKGRDREIVTVLGRQDDACQRWHTAPLKPASHQDRGVRNVADPVGVSVP